MTAMISIRVMALPIAFEVTSIPPHGMPLGVLIVCPPGSFNVQIPIDYKVSKGNTRVRFTVCS